ncbi:MAG: hypothetical protein ACE5F8_00985 [Woeseiaceae bacterium]
MNKDSIREQVRRNAVALISLFVAVTGLLYNTWRNEHSEHNRNQRWGSFQALLVLGELQEIVYIYYHDPQNSDKSDMRRGWAKVLTIKHLADILDDPLPANAVKLHGVWQDNWEGLRDRNLENRNNIDMAIEDFRQDTLMSLRELE